MVQLIQLPVTDLTLREREVLSYVAEGFSSKEIAALLCISEHTVANHRRNILRKGGVKTSAQMVRYNRVNYMG